MYKRFTYDELCNINTNFFKNLKNIYSSKSYTFFKEFIKDIFDEWDCVYYFESNDIIFRIFKNSDNIVLIDEKEKIEFICTQVDVGKIHNLLKNDKKVSNIKKDNQTILENLIESFQKQEFKWLLDKPFLVYDVETIWSINDLRVTKFALWYSLISDEDHSKNLKFKYISEENLKKFVDYMLWFDWYIVWFNNIYFDNQVVAYNSWYWEEEIKKLNKKSLDIFLFIWNLTWKRYWLDKVSSALIWLSKTLSSWMEWEQMLKEYMKTKDESLLSKVKSYCKNDVKMTLWVLLYLLQNNILYIDWEDIDYDIKKLIELWSKERWKEKKEENIKTIFN